VEILECGRVSSYSTDLKIKKDLRLRSATCKVLEGTEGRNNPLILLGTGWHFQSLIHQLQI